MTLYSTKTEWSLMKNFLLTFLSLLFFTCGKANGQFVRLNMNIEPELNAEVLKPLNFGMVVTNSGRHAIQIGDPGMGVFAITAADNKQVIISLDIPDYLSSSAHTDDVIPLNLHCSYNNHDSNEYRVASPFPLKNTASFRLYDRMGIQGYGSSITNERKTSYVYVYGSIDIGNIDEGRYTGLVTMTVEYE